MTVRECLINEQHSCPNDYLCRFNAQKNRYFCCSSLAKTKSSFVNLHQKKSQFLEKVWILTRKHELHSKRLIGAYSECIFLHNTEKNFERKRAKNVEFRCIFGVLIMEYTRFIFEAKSNRLRWDSNPGPLDSNPRALPLSQVHVKILIFNFAYNFCFAHNFLRLDFQVVV